MRALLPIAALSLLSCKDSNGTQDSDAFVGTGTCDSADDGGAFVMRQMYFARVEDGVGWGFDLDGHDSVTGDPEGCGKQDLNDPDGNGGIDNAFAGLLPTLEATEAVAVEGLLQDSISSGELLMVIELSGVDDWQNDDCITVKFGKAVGSPLVGTDGTLLDGQTFGWDPEAEVTVVQDVAIVDGTVVAPGVDFTLDLQILNAHFEILVSNGAVRLDIDPDGTVSTGFFGGGFSIDYMLDVLNGEAIDQGLLDILNQVLPITADLSADDTTCRHMSVTLEYEAIPAYTYVQ